MKDAPILDKFFDEGIINKSNYTKSESQMIRLDTLEKYGVNTALFIFSPTLPEFLQEKAVEFYTFSNASNRNMVYLYDNKFLIALTPLGGPAAVGLMEELGFMNITNFFCCGSAGQIDFNFDPTDFILVEKAIRDEGTSYHYLEPHTFAETSKTLTNAWSNYLTKNNFKFTKAITWTTDAFYRETKQTVDKRRSQGAVCVEMESASLCAAAKFLGFQFAQLLYFSDAVQQNAWAWHPTKKELKNKVIELSVNFVTEFTTK